MKAVSKNNYPYFWTVIIVEMAIILKPVHLYKGHREIFFLSKKKKKTYCDIIVLCSRAFIYKPVTPLQLKCPGMSISAWTNWGCVCVGWCTRSLLFVVISFISIWECIKHVGFKMLNTALCPEDLSEWQKLDQCRTVEKRERTWRGWYFSTAARQHEIGVKLFLKDICLTGS